MPDEIERLRSEFEAMRRHDEPQKRGYRLELIMFDLLKLSGLEPRAPYRLPHEQIDGSFTLDGGDYLLEAKWWNSPVERADADAFAGKIRRKGRNTMGLFMSINGFSKGFLATPQDGGMPFIAADGNDLLSVLSGRIDLPNLLRRKRRHLSETGECLMRVQ